VSARRAAGFTLVELLVAMTLLGLLMAVILGGLRLGTRTFERAEGVSERLAELGAAHDFLRTALAQARFSPEPAAAVEERWVFLGDERHLTLHTKLPDHVAEGRLSTLSLELEGGAGDLRLVASWRPYGSRLADAPAGSAVLLEHLRAADFAFLDPEHDEAPWSALWLATATLPPLVRIRAMMSDGRQLPDLVVALPSAG
jgi:general secretion pathway protein J